MKLEPAHVDAICVGDLAEDVKMMKSPRGTADAVNPNVTSSSTSKRNIDTRNLHITKTSF